MIRQTSIDAYIKIKEDGLLSKRRFQVYEYVFKYGPCSARDCHKYYAAQGTNSSSFIGRFSELRDSGVIEESGEKFDEETRQTVLTWKTTGALPIKLEKPKRYKCKHCNGKGYTEETQARLI